MVSAPFGLKTEYDDNWQGRYFAHTSDVEIIDLTLAAALDIVPDKFSVGAGLIVLNSMIGAGIYALPSALLQFGAWGPWLFVAMGLAMCSVVMAFARLEDLDGSFDLVIFQEPYARCASVLKSATGADSVEGPRPLLVIGTLETGDPPKVLVRDVLPLERAEEKLASSLRVRIRAEEATLDRLTALKRLLENRPGECGVTLRWRRPSARRSARSSSRGSASASSIRSPPTTIAAAASPSVHSNRK